jgi:hypothetical protein
MAAMCIWGREYISPGALLDASMDGGGRVIEGMDDGVVDVVTSRITVV